MSLFEEFGGAEFSECGQYRYKLARIWRPGDPLMAFVMLNPSFANEVFNDPTIERCQRRAQDLGYGGLLVANAFALISTDPSRLYYSEDPIGPDNDQAIMETVQRAALVVCGWGDHGNYMDRGRQVLSAILSAGAVPHCLKQNQDGQPTHPLYLSYKLPPVPVRLDLLMSAET